MKNKKATRIGGLLVAVAALSASCQIRQAAKPAAFDGQRAYENIVEQMDWGPRFPGTEGHQTTQAWITKELISLGWNAEQQCFENRGVELCNILGWSPGDSSAEPYVLLGAHYDTRRLADSDPVRFSEPVPGANDGASGVAVLLELARIIDPGLLDDGVLLAFFDGEDQGHIDGWDWSVGASYYANTLQRAPEAVVIVDMVGDRDLQIYIENNSDPALADEIWSIASREGFKGFIAEPKHAIIDDHLPFVQRAIPAVDIIDIEYPAWHTTHDTLDQISAESLYQVGRTVQIWLETR